MKNLHTLFITLYAGHFFSQSAGTWMKLGDDERDPVKKIEYYSKVIEKKPHNIEALNKRARAYFAVAQFDNAGRDCDASLLELPSSVDNLVLKANCCLKVADYSCAFKNCDLALNRQANSPDAFRIRGLTFSAVEDYEKAVEDLNEAISSLPGDKLTLYERAFAFYKLKKNKTALKDLNVILEEDSLNATALALRGAVYHKLDRLEDAVQDARIALREDSAVVLPYFVLADAEFQRTNFQKAMKFCTMAIKMDGTNPDYMALKSKIHDATGNSAEALRFIELALDRKPEYPPYLCHRAEVKFRMSRYNEASADIEHAIELNPKEAAFQIKAGIFQEQLGNYEKAIKSYENASGLSESCAECYAAISRCQRILGLHDQALENANKAITMNSHESSAFISRGIVQISNGRYNEAVEDLVRALRISPGSSMAAFEISYAKYRQADYKTALEYVNQAIDLKTSFANAWLLRGLINSKLGNKDDAAIDQLRSGEFVKGINNKAEMSDFDELSRELAGMLSDTLKSGYVTADVKAGSRKVALVIGVKNYAKTAPLTNSINDAVDMSKLLKRKGFEVIELLDPKTKSDMKGAALRYGRALQNDQEAVGLLYYSGHGMQIDGVNYLMPTDVNLEVKADVADQCMDLDYLMSVMTGNGNKLSIIIMDACRNNPFRSFTRSADKGLGVVNTPKGSYIVYATKPGSVASDGSDRNGLFTSKLLKFLNEPGLNIEQVFKKVAGEVGAASNDKQRPWIASDFTGDFYFTPN
jgi:tetratricopeptide (TPR) repeat protein